MYELKVSQNDFSNVWTFDNLQALFDFVAYMFKADNVAELLKKQKEYNAKIYITYKND